MKKYFIILSILSASLLIIFMLVLSTMWYIDSKSEYSLGGMDTEKAFGNGRYSILLYHITLVDSPVYNSKNYKNAYDFFDVKEQKAIDDNVFKYKDIKPYAYVIGKNGYTVLNYQTGEFKQSKKLNDFTKTETKILLDESNYTNLQKGIFLEDDKWLNINKTDN